MAPRFASTCKVVNRAILVQPATEADLHRVRQVLPKTVCGTINGQTTIAVKHGIKETLALRALGYDVESPLAHGWTYPGMYSPRVNQKKTAEFLVINRRAYVFNEMRTGKTAASLWAAEYLLQHDVIKRVLIVCPKQCMRLVWEQTLFEVLPHRSCAVLYGDKKKRLKELDKNTTFCIINHDGLSALSEKSFNGLRRTVNCSALRGKFDLIIYDEADVLSNHRTLMYKALVSLLEPTTWLWPLTATPTGGAYADTWGLLKLVVPKPPVSSWTQWRELTMVKVGQFRWVNRPGAERTVFDALQPAIRFTQAECFDLPPVDYLQREVELSAAQRRCYRQIQQEGIVERKEGDIVAVNAAAKMIKMLQVACGVVRDEHGQPVILDCEDRLRVLRDTLREVGCPKKKAIVAVPFVYVMDYIKQELDRKGYRSAVINGEVPHHAREAAIRKWQGTDYDVLIVHPEVTAHGLDLTASDTLIYYCPPYGVKLFKQLNARIMGEKQKGSPTIIYMSATNLERERYRALQKGIEDTDSLLNMYHNALEEAI
jgi:superfamily II DNA or RNA helicase